MYRLLQTRDGDGAIAEALRAGPAGLAELVAGIMRERFVDDATRVTRYLRAYSDPAWDEITGVDLEDVVGAFTARLVDA